jgi:hypothetical protein
VSAPVCGGEPRARQHGQEPDDGRDADRLRAEDRAEDDREAGGDVRDHREAARADLRDQLVGEQERERGREDAERDDRADDSGARRVRRQRERRRDEQHQGRDGQGRGQDGDRLDAGEAALEQVRAGSIADARADAEHSTEEVAAHLDPQHERDAAEPDPEAEGAHPGRPVGVGDEEREQAGDDRRRRDEHARERRRDVLLSVGEQDERPDELHEREHDDVREPAAHGTESPSPRGEAGDDRRADHDAAEDDDERREIPDGDLDQQVGDPPQGRRDQQQRDDAPVHLRSNGTDAERVRSITARHRLANRPEWTSPGAWHGPGSGTRPKTA